MSAELRATKYSNPIHQAAYGGEEEKLAHLLENAEKLAVEIRDGSDLDTALIAAVRAHRENRKIITMLMDAGAETAVTNKWGYTPLRLAARKTDGVALRVLVERGADVHFKNPLRDAIEADQAANVRYLLSKGADINYHKEHQSPNIFGAQSAEMVELILAEKVDVDGGVEDGKGYTPLHRAVIDKKDQLALSLARNGANVNARDKSGETPLYHAVIKRSGVLVNILLNRGADPDLKIRGNSILELAKSQYSFRADNSTQFILEALKEHSKEQQKLENASCAIS